MAQAHGYARLEKLLTKEVYPLLGVKDGTEAVKQYNLGPLVRNLVRTMTVDGVDYYLIHPKLSQEEREAIVNAYRKHEPTGDVVLGQCDRCVAPARDLYNFVGGTLAFCDHHARELGLKEALR